MKIALLCISLLLLPASAQEIPDEDFIKHVNNIAEIVPSLQNEIDQLEKRCFELEATIQEIQNKYNVSDSILQKSKLKVQLTYYRQTKKTKKADYQRQRSQLYIYYCLLAAFSKHTLTDKQYQVSIKYQPQWQQQQQQLQGQIIAAQQRKVSNAKYIRDTRTAIKEHQEKIAVLKKQLEVLEAKKHWGNLKDRLALQSQIGYHQSMIIKCKGEIAVRSKLQANAQQEAKSRALEYREIQTALSMLPN